MRRDRPASISIVVTTYNWPAALALSLRSMLRQSRLPDEIVVADDGSGPDTAALVAQLAGDSPLPIRHAWQPDDGFRAARARNRAIAACRGDYVLLFDGDMVLHRDCVADHVAAARHGCLVQGMRVLSREAGARRILEEGRLDVRFGDPGMRRRRHTLRLPWLSRMLQPISERASLAGIKTCNQGWWRADLLALGGFEERMQGWGREDEELAARAFHAGMRRRSLRFAGLAVHLWHAERHQDGESRNDALLADTLATRRTRAVEGIDAHLAEFAQAPLADLREQSREPASA